MKIYQKYVIINYLKNFFIILSALEFFYLGIDLLTNYHKLPKSANLQILYMLFQGMNAINYLLPLSVVFAMIVTKVSLVRTNELISMYTLGISRQKLLMPLFFSSLSITIIYIVFNFTPFSYAKEYASNLKSFNQISTFSKDIFFKNGNNYIYFEKLNPIKKIATNIKIFKVEKHDLVSIIDAEKGYFKGTNWVLYNVKVTIKPKVKTLSAKGLIVRKFSRINELEGVKPKIIDNIYKGKYNLSILDAIEALKFFNSQGLKTDRIRTIVLSQLFLPLFAPFLVIIFFYKVPLIARYYNLTIVSFGLSFMAISVWGILFLLTKLAYSSTVMPEIAIMLPIFILGIFAFYSYYKK